MVADVVADRAAERDERVETCTLNAMGLFSSTRRELTLTAALALTTVACGGDDPGTSDGGSGSGANGAGGGNGGNGAAGGAGAVLACPAGELLADDGVTCLPPGISAGECGAGFEHDGDVGCEPILTATACVGAEMAVPGDASCRAIAACPISDAPTDGTTEYVNASFGGSSDGSAQAPWTTVQQAVSAAASGAVIAIAPGTYTGAIVIDKPVRLWGACPESVSLTGGVIIQGNADAAELHALAIGGSQAGVSIDGAEGVLLDRVRVHGTGWIGIDVRDSQGPASVVIEDSVVDDATSVGIYSSGSAVTLRRSEVRDVQSQGGDFGYGLSGEHDAFTGRRASFTVESSYLHGLKTAGVTGWGIDVTIDDSVIRDVAPRPLDQLFGYAVGVDRQEGTGERGMLTMRGSLVERAYYCGVCAWDSEMTLERVVVRNMSSTMANGDEGTSVRASDLAEDEPLKPTVSLDRVLVENGQHMGVGLFGAEATITRIVVRDIVGTQKDGLFGHLISAQSTFGTEEPSHLVLRGAHLSRGLEAGLTALGATIEAEGVLIEDVGTRPDGLFGVPFVIGMDIVRDLPAGGTVNQVVLDGGHTGGFVVLGADVSANDLVVRDIQPDLYSDQFGDGIIASSFIFAPTLFETNVALGRVTVEGAPRAGIASFSSNMEVATSALDCNTIALDAEAVLDGEAILVDGGGNRCGCGQDEEECKVLQTGIEPPTPPL